MSASYLIRVIRATCHAIALAEADPRSKTFASRQSCTCCPVEANWTARACCITGRRMMIGAARIYFIVFGILTIAGGIVGYVKAGSVISLIAGSISGGIAFNRSVANAGPSGSRINRGPACFAPVSWAIRSKSFSNSQSDARRIDVGLELLGIIVAIAAWLRK